MSPAASAAQQGGGYHVEAVKTIDDSSLLIPSQLPGHERPGSDVLALPDSSTLVGGREGGLFSNNNGTLSGQELAECARMLGIDVIFDTDLLYIAEELLTSPLPEGWERYTAGGGKQYYFNKQTRVTQWAHPLEEYYRCVVFMRKEGDEALERKALDNPPTPDEVREMAKYLGVDYRSEFGLLDICKAAVNAPLPPEWEEYEDENGEMYYVHKLSKQQLENHPLDGYFIEVIRQRRQELAQGLAAPHEPRLDEFWEIDEATVPYPWMEFVEGESGKLYYYNFPWNAVCYDRPHNYVRHLLRTRACVMIQSLWRGHYVRKTHRLLVLELAAKDIQRVWRGFQARKQYRGIRDQALVESATVVQALFRGRKVRMDRFAQTRNVSAAVIQARWRAYMQKQRIRRAAARLPLPLVPPPTEYLAGGRGGLTGGVAAALARVAHLADELLDSPAQQVSKEPPLESCTEDGEPLIFPWMRIPKAPTGSGFRRIGSMGRSRPRRSSQSSRAGGSRGGSAAGTPSGRVLGVVEEMEGGTEFGVVEAAEAGGGKPKVKKGKKKGRPVKRKEKSPGKKRSEK